MSQSKASRQRVEAQEMRAKALALRRAGASYDRIGAELGISKKNAHKHVVNALADLAKNNLELAEQVRALDLQRLDEMQSSIYAAALKPVPKTALDKEGRPVVIDDGRDQQLRVIDRIIKIQERRASLVGSDAAKRVEQSGPGGEPISVKARGGLFDLSKLSVEELRQYRAILVAAGVQEDQESPKAG